MMAYIALTVAFVVTIFLMLLLPEIEAALEDSEDLARRQPEGAE